MNLKELLQAVLVPALFVVVKYFFNLIGFDAGDEMVTALVTAFVSWLLSLFFVRVAVKSAPKYFAM